MRAIRKVLHMAARDEEVLSQSNPKNKDGNFWCGRTSASLIYNYYARLGRVPGPIKNRSDEAPYQLVYPDRSFAALTPAGECAPGEVFDRLARAGVGRWDYVPLYPREARGSAPSVEAVFGQLLDHLDRNNPAFFASGFSESGKYASHFITITGYRFREGLWLQITDPATNHKVVKRLLQTAEWPNERIARVVEVECDGAWASPKSTVHAFGSRYWVHEDVFWVANKKLVGNDRMAQVGYPRPLLCDNSYHPGFAVLIDLTQLQTADTYADTALAAGWPIVPARSEPKGGAQAGPNAASLAQATDDWWRQTEETDDWYWLLDGSAAFPLGSALTWHGGVHIQGAHAKDKLVYAIGPGEIVLARFPDESSPSPLSNGFVLVRHRIDPLRRAFLEPQEQSQRPLDVYSLYMHIGPLQRFLTHDPEQDLEVLSAGDRQGPDPPPWLRAICPLSLPPLRRYVASSALRHRCIHPDRAAAGRKDGWTSLPASKTETGQVGAELEYLESAHEITLAGAASEVLPIEGADHLVLPCGPISVPALGIRALRVFEPAVPAGRKLHYWNPLTLEILDIRTVDVPKATPIRVNSVKRQVESFPANGKLFAELDLGSPGMLHSAPGLIEGQKLRIFRKPVTLVAKAHGAVGSKEIGLEHRLFFEWLEGRPHIIPVVSATGKVLTRWKASGRRSPPISVASSEVCAWNPVSEELLPLVIPPGADLSLVPRKKGTHQAWEAAGASLVEVCGVELSLEHAEGDGPVGDQVVFFEHSTRQVRIFAVTGGKGDMRHFVEHPRVEIANAEALLAFRCQERATTGASKKLDRLWLDLVACVPVTQAELDSWNKELAAAEQTRLCAMHERIRKGYSRLMGVKFSRKSGWQIKDSQKGAAEDLIATADLPDECKQRARTFCEVEVHDGALALREVKSDRGPSPWEVACDESTTIHPLCILRGKKGAAWGAVFELLVTTPKILRDDGERDKVRKDSKIRHAKIQGYRRGQVFSPPDDPLRRVSRTPVAAFSDRPDAFIHLEVFAARNPIDPAVRGTNETIVSEPKPFHVLLDEDSRDDYAPEFVENLMAQFRSSSLPDLDMAALRRAEHAHDVVQPDEWRDFSLENFSPLSCLIAAHATEWHPARAAVLDAVGGAGRGLHLSPAEVEAHKSEVRRLAFFDKWPEAPAPDAPLYHIHPFRFLEWLLTGVDVAVRGASDSATLRLAQGGREVQLTPEPDGTNQPAAEGAQERMHRARLMIGDGLRQDSATLVLASGFETNHPRLPVVIRRGTTLHLTVVNPNAKARAEGDVRPQLDTAVGVAISPGIKEGFLLADGGKLPNHQLSYARVVLSVDFNLLPPTRITAKLVPSAGFALRSTDPAVKVAEDCATASFEPPQPSGEHPEGDSGQEQLFTGAQRITMTVDVLAKDQHGAKTEVHFELEGGDLVSPHPLISVPVATREAIRSDQKAGEDVAKLQLYLSQIEADDGRPCYRYCGVAKDKTHTLHERREYEHGTKQAVLVDGVYKLGLARALWQFLYSFAADLPLEAVEITRPKAKKGAAAPPGPSKIPIEDLRLGGRGQSARAERTGQECSEFPVVTGKLVAEIVRRFRLPHVLPRVDLSVEAGTGRLDLSHAHGVGMADGWTKTESGKSAILPTASDSIVLLVDAPAMGILEGDFTVDLEVPSASAYQFGDTHGPCKAVTFSGTTRKKVALVFHEGHITNKPEDNVVKASAVVRGSRVELRSLQLYGTRDLMGSPKDGAARRDAALVQACLAAQHYYAPPAKGGTISVDGKWNDSAKKALEAFAAESNAGSSGPAAIEFLTTAGSLPSPQR
jgi:hypothetical protein